MRIEMENQTTLPVHPPSALDPEKLLAAFLDGYGDFRLGSLIRGIVHNLNGSLQILSMQMEILQRMLQKEEAISPAIREKTDRCIAQVEQFGQAVQVLMRRALEREEELSPKINLNEILDAELAMAHHDLFFKHQVRVERALSPSLPPLKGKRHEVSQAIGNLIQNAIEAMENSPRKELKICTMAGVNSAEVLIQDTGCGLDPEMRSRLFQPFFSTKGGRHRGLGLYVARYLLEPYRADFTYTFQSDRTVLRMVFPVLMSAKKKKS
jgi:two-component system, NtrC family, sensor kinase